MECLSWDKTVLQLISDYIWSSRNKSPMVMFYQCETRFSLSIGFGINEVEINLWDRI